MNKLKYLLVIIMLLILNIFTIGSSVSSAYVQLTNQGTLRNGSRGLVLYRTGSPF